MNIHLSTSPPAAARPSSAWAASEQRHAALAPLLLRLEAQFPGSQVWLFGSRARGDARPDSDWDLLVVTSDETPEEQLDPVFLWHVQRGSGVYADVIACRASEFREASDTVNTLAYTATTEGVRLDGR